MPYAGRLPSSESVLQALNEFRTCPPRDLPPGSAERAEQVMARAREIELEEWLAKVRQSGGGRFLRRVK